MSDDLWVGAHGAGQHDTAGAHGFNDRHPKRFLAVLQIDTEAADLYFLRQLTLPDCTVKCNTHLGLRDLPGFPP
jgi:hypothetical protein